MTQQTNRSSYGNKNASGAKLNSNAAAGAKSTSPTHSVYQLIDGERSYVNDVFVYENDGQFGKYLSMIVNGPVPTGRLFITKKKPADA